MDQNLVYAKTPNGDDAVRQSTRVVQRNLRLVLVQVDGKTSVAELSAKIGDSRMVENALQELEKGGFIAPVLHAPSVWETSKKVAQEIKAAASQFSTFGPKSVRPGESVRSVHPDDSLGSALSVSSDFSTFDAPFSRPGRLQASLSKQLDERGPSVATPHEADHDDVRPPRRLRPVVFLKILLVLLFLLGVGIVFFPYNNFKPEIEAAVSGAFRTPVRIGNVTASLLPRPALALQSIKFGTEGEARADEIRIPSLLFLVGRGPQRIAAIDISGLVMPAEGLGAMLGAGASPQTSRISIGQARLQHMTVRMKDIALRNLEGEMSFRGDGGLEKLKLQTEDRTLRIEAVPTAQGGALSIEGMSWKPSEDSPYVFESLQAKGLLQTGKLVLNDIDTTFMGGVLKGSWLLNWSDGMAMAGEASLARMSVRRVADAFAPTLKIEGELSGALRLRGSGKDWHAMWANVDASLDAEIVRGLLTGVDLGEAVRRGGRATRGGSTKFDRLRGVIVVNPRQVAGRDIHLEAGLISASGRFAADYERKVDASLDVSINSSVSAVRMPIKVSGTLPDLVVASGH